MDKITYEEIFLILNSKDSKSITVGELDPGFDALELHMLKKLPHFPADWRSILEMGSPNETAELWRR